MCLKETLKHTKKLVKCLIFPHKSCKLHFLPIVYFVILKYADIVKQRDLKLNKQNLCIIKVKNHFIDLSPKTDL